MVTDSQLSRFGVSDWLETSRAVGNLFIKFFLSSFCLFLEIQIKLKEIDQQPTTNHTNWILSVFVVVFYVLRYFLQCLRPQVLICCLSLLVV